MYSQVTQQEEVCTPSTFCRKYVLPALLNRRYALPSVFNRRYIRGTVRGSGLF